MTPILTAAQMRAAEQAVFDSGMDAYALMERAGAAAAEIIWRAGGRRDTLIACGPGNNGGDGYVIARLLAARGVPVRVAALGESTTASARRARAGWDGLVEMLANATPATQLVDALFGTGLSHGLDPAVAARLCALAGAASLRCAIDLPSGVDSDSGALLSPVPVFDICIALGALKPAHLLHPAASRIRRLHCADIGISASDEIHLLAPPRLHVPPSAAHKYSRGLVAVIDGAMPGAALLASAAAARSGAGMVRVLAVSAEQADCPHALVHQAAETSSALTEMLADPRIAVALVGPGLGRDDAARARLDATLKAGHAMVLDADALTLLAESGLGHRTAQCAIFTPHEGEFQRLFGPLPGSKIDRALAAARRAGAVVIYKGADTVIAAPDGRAAVAQGASTWLSTAGTGDVLAGLAAGRLAATGDAFRAACEAVWLHGEAARRAGPAFIADDLLDTLSGAIAARL